MLGNLNGPPGAGYAISCLWSPVTYGLEAAFKRQHQQSTHISTLIIDDFYKSQPWKDAEQRKTTNPPASHPGGRRAEVCGEPGTNWHIGSVDMAASKRRAAKQNTLRPPIGSLDVIDPVCRRSPLARSGSVREPRRAHTGRLFRELTEERGAGTELLFMGQRQEKACYTTITSYDDEAGAVWGQPINRVYL